jgi:phospholipase A1/A2
MDEISSQILETWRIHQRMTLTRALSGGFVVKLMIAIFTVTIWAVISVAGELLLQNDSTRTVQPADSVMPSRDVNNPVNTLPTEQQQQSPESAYFGKKTDRPVSAHKLNYFSIDQWPRNENAQIKFSISMKFRVLEPNLYILKYNLFPIYISYSQKSLWNIGQKSMPFEESNFNPECFLDYSINTKILGRLKLCNVVICLFEHESNGLLGDKSRSWNRQYILIRFGIESKEKLEITNSFLSDKAALYVKLWYASGYSDQDVYLEAIGNSYNFLDYMGWGEIGISVRNFFWGGGLRNHQLDIKTPILRDFRNSSYEIEFRQQIPELNFALYIQYYYGYRETLLRFDKLGNRGFVGFSFSY